MELNSADLIEPDPPPPKLSIFHLLCWTAGTAIIATCLRQYPQPEDAFLPRVVFQCFMLVSAIASGLAVASLLLFARYGFRRPCVFPRQPGHWMLVCGGFQAVCGWPAYFAALGWFAFLARADILRETPWPAEMHAQLIQSLAANIVGCTVALTATASIREVRWRALWILWLVQGLFEAVAAAVMLAPDSISFYSLYSLSFPINAAICTLYLSAQTIVIVGDRRSPRDWLHYAGLAVAYVFFAMTPIYYVLFRLFVRQ